MLTPKSWVLNYQNLADIYQVEKSLSTHIKQPTHESSNNIQNKYNRLNQLYLENQCVRIPA